MQCVLLWPALGPPVLLLQHLLLLLLLLRNPGV
jgi:hypothetical protein